MESHVLGVNKGIESYIAPWAVDVTNPLAPHLVEWGEATRRVYDEFVSGLENWKSTYHSVTDVAGAVTPSQQGSMMGDISLKRLLDAVAKPTPLGTRTGRTTRNRRALLWPRSPTSWHRFRVATGPLSYQSTVPRSEPQNPPPSAGETRPTEGKTEDTARRPLTTNRKSYRNLMTTKVIMRAPRKRSVFLPRPGCSMPPPRGNNEVQILSR